MFAILWISTHTATPYAISSIFVLLDRKSLNFRIQSDKSGNNPAIASPLNHRQEEQWQTATHKLASLLSPGNFGKPKLHTGFGFANEHREIVFMASPVTTSIIFVFKDYRSFIESFSDLAIEQGVPSFSNKSK